MKKKVLFFFVAILSIILLIVIFLNIFNFSFWRNRFADQDRLAGIFSFELPSILKAYDDVILWRGYYYVTKDELKGIIKESGEIMLSPEYKMIRPSPCGKFAIVSNGDKFGLYDLYNRSFCLAMIYDYIKTLSPDMFLLTMDKQDGLYSITQKFILPCRYDFIKSAFHAFGDLTYDRQWDLGVYFAYEKDSILFINKESIVAFPRKGVRTDIFYSDLCPIVINNERGYLTKNGTLLLPSNDTPWIYREPGHTVMRKYYKGNFSILDYNERTIVDSCIWISRFIDSNAIFQNDDGFGIVNLKGDIITSGIGRLIPISPSIFLVESNGKKGLIYNNLLTVNPIYEQITTGYLDSIFIVKDDRKYGIITANGTLLLPCQYKRILSAHDSVFIILNERGYGFFDIETSILHSPKFSYLGVFREGKNVFLNRYGGDVYELGVISKRGIIIESRKYLRNYYK